MLALLKNISLDNLIYYLLKGVSGLILVGAFWLIDKIDISSGEFSMSYSRSVLFQGLLISPFVSFLIRDWNFTWISFILKRLWLLGLFILIMGLYEGCSYLWELFVAIVAGVSVLLESAELRNYSTWKKNWIILTSTAWKGFIFLAFLYNQSLQLYVISGGLMIFLFSFFQIEIKSEQIVRTRKSYLLLIIFSMGALRTYIDKWVVFHDVSEDLLAGYIMNVQLAQSVPLLAMGILSTKFTTALYVVSDRLQDTTLILKRTLIGFFGLVLSGLILILLFNFVVVTIFEDVYLFLVLFFSGVVFFASQIIGTDLIAAYKLNTLLAYNISLSLVPFTLFMIYPVNTVMEVALISTFSCLLCLLIVLLGRKFAYA